jgi:transposase
MCIFAKKGMYTSLDDLIQRSHKSTEVKRAQAVKQDLANKNRQTIADILEVSVSFISKWRLIYEQFGAEGLRSLHQGAKPRAFLSEQQKAAVLAHISSHTVFGYSDLVAYLTNAYGVAYKHSQSYYDLLHQAGMTWHKSQKRNPRRQPQQVAARRQEIKKN